MKKSKKKKNITNKHTFLLQYFINACLGLPLLISILFLRTAHLFRLRLNISLEEKKNVYD